MLDDFIRYLAAKKSVDNRSLNRHVWQALQHTLPANDLQNPLRVLEIGAGIGTMVERMWAWELANTAIYTAIDARTENVAAAQDRLQRWGYDSQLAVQTSNSGLCVSHRTRRYDIHLEAIDVFDFAVRERGQRRWDLLIAHAFLDLVDIPTALPQFLQLLEPSGLFYLTIVFDGVTSFQPEIDPVFDTLIESLYHRTISTLAIFQNRFIIRSRLLHIVLYKR